MKKILTAMLLAATATLSVQAQTADEIIDKYYDAIGGKAALAKISNTTTAAKLNTQGMELPITMIQTNDGKMKVTISVQGMEIVQPAFDGETGWQTNFQTMQPEKMDAEQNKLLKDQAADFPDAFMKYKEKGYTATNEGEESVDGVDTYRVKLVKSPIMIDGKEEENATFYFFDKDSGALIMTRSEAKAGPTKGMVIESYMSDYQAVDGIMFPFSMEQKLNGQSVVSIVVDAIELNKTIDNSIFAFPN